MTFLIDAGMVMYWGTSRWTPFEIFEAYSVVSKDNYYKSQNIREVTLNRKGGIILNNPN